MFNVKVTLGSEMSNHIKEHFFVGVIHDCIMFLFQNYLAFVFNFYLHNCMASFCTKPNILINSVHEAYVGKWFDPTCSN